MQKIFLHIGTHKTGSTAIQTFLTKNRDVLKKRGVIYPVNACPDIAKFGHHMLPWAFVKDEGFVPRLYGEKLSSEDKRELVQGVLSEAKLNDVIILSSEEFSTLTFEEVKELKSYFKDYDVEVIVYLRRQDKYLESAYKTSVLSGSVNKNITDFCENQRLNLNYLSLVEMWGSTFGKIAVRSYEDKSISHDIVGDFLKLVNLHELHIEGDNERANISLNAEIIEVIRALRLRGENEDNIKQIKKRALSLTLGNKRSTFINNEMFNSMRDKYTCNNGTIYEQYGCNLAFDGPLDYSNSINNLEQCLISITKEMLIKKE